MVWLPGMGVNGVRPTGPLGGNGEAQGSGGRICARHFEFFVHEECEGRLRLRDAEVTQIYNGTSEIQKVVIARHVLSNTSNGVGGGLFPRSL